MSALLCERCGNSALVIYERKPLCSPCAVEALDENHHYLVVQVDERDSVETADNNVRTSESG